MLELRPILSALMRSRVALVLLGLQIALTLAITCNALFIIGERAALMARPSGIAEADSFILTSIGFGAGYDLRRSIADDLALLRALPGVVAAAPVNTLPMMSGEGPFGPLEMGGMFTVFKVRKDQPPGDYKDPGPYRFPAGTVAYEWTGSL